MADASHPFDSRRRRSRDWGEAFANLPLDTPPLSVWSQIAARLDANADAAAGPAADAAPAEIAALPLTASAAATRGSRLRRALSPRAWLALAASLSALALLPLLWPGSRDASVNNGVADRGAHPANAANALIVAPPKAASSNEPRGMPAIVASAAPASGSADSVRSASVDTASINTDSIGKIPALPGDEISMRVDKATLESAPAFASAATTSVAPLRLPQVQAPAETTAADSATASLDADALPANAVLVGDTDADATSHEMELLYAASAQLETLLAYTREPRVETGPAAALSSEIHIMLARIDAQLAQPGLSADEQYALWQARVGTLRQAVAVESQLRVLSAEGQDEEGRVVEVY